MIVLPRTICMKMSSHSIYQKFIGQVLGGTANSPVSERTSTIASFIIALSGLILYTDKALAFLHIEVSMPEKFAENGVSPEIFVWIVAQTLSPLLIIAGSILRPYFYAYIIPVYCYILQFYFVLMDYSLVDDGYSYAYAFGITFLLIVIMQFARKASQRETRLMIDKMKDKVKTKLEHAD